MEFFARLALLVLLMAVIAAIDAWRNRAKATRWREYSFLLAAGLLGAAVGVVNDHFTSTLSPEYFLIGKGLSLEHFRLQVTLLGFQAGFSAGVILGCGYLLANNPRPGRPSLPMRQLFRLALYPLLAAALVVPMTAATACLFDVLRLLPDLRATLAALLTPAQMFRFRIVWAIHLGLYLGGLLGGIRGIAKVARRNAPGETSRV
jgi:hypothetical protein